jgi:hypothetical protein
MLLRRKPVVWLAGVLSVSASMFAAAPIAPACACPPPPGMDCCETKHCLNDGLAARPPTATLEDAPPLVVRSYITAASVPRV